MTRMSRACSKNNRRYEGRKTSNMSGTSNVLLLVSVRICVFSFQRTIFMESLTRSTLLPLTSCHVTGTSCGGEQERHRMKMFLM